VTGRSNVFEKTDVGTAIVHFEDRNRHLDTDALVGNAIQLQIRNPVTGVWEPTWRGVIDEPTFDVYPLTGGLVSTVQLRCVDLFAYLARVEMVPGLHGHPPNHGFEGSVTFGVQRVDDRIRTLLYGTYDDSATSGNGVGKGAQIDPSMSVVFTGNVRLWDTAYDPGESILVGLRDAADAEIPGVANIYVDRHGPGRLVFHGRESRFDPDGTAYPGVEWAFRRWKGGDGAAIAADPTTAQLRSLAYARPSSYIYNAAIAWPKYVAGTKPNTKRTFSERDKEAQVYADLASISGEYGYRALPPMGDLLVMDGYGAHNAGNDGPTECRGYAEFYVENYKTPHRSPVVTFKTVRPEDPRGAATWKLLTQLDISDVLALTVGAAGLAAEEYFVEGYRLTVEPLTPTYDYVELTPNLTPVARYAHNPWT